MQAIVFDNMNFVTEKLYGPDASKNALRDCPCCPTSEEEINLAKAAFNGKGETESTYDKLV